MTPARRLRPVPETAPRALGYVRVSMAREEMVSPELQVAAIEAYCAQRGYRLVDTIAELDVTGRNFARKGVIEAIERIERSEAEVIVVWKVSRFGRTRKDWYIHADRVEVAGGSLESATEHFDPLTSTGRLTRGMLVELAAWESDVKSEQWKEAHEYRYRQGLTHNGSPRFGYVFDKAEKIHRVDPETGPVLAEMYRRYIAGQNPYAIARWVNSLGIRTTKGAQWSAATVRQVLSKGFGAGYVYRSHRPPVGKPRIRQPEFIPGAHEAVISEREWQAYLRAKRGNATEPARVRSGVNPLSGLVVCDTCKHRMSIWQGWVKTGKDRRKFYRGYKCVKSNEQCGRNYVAVPLLHEAVKAWLEAEVAADLDARAQTKAQQLAKREVVKADRATVAAQVRENEKALLRLTDAYARGITPEAAYTAAVAALEAEKRDLEQRLAVLDADAASTKANVPTLTRNLLRDYDTLLEQNPAGMKPVLHSLIGKIIVRPGRSRPDKVEVIERWRAHEGPAAE